MAGTFCSTICVLDRSSMKKILIVLLFALSSSALGNVAWKMTPVHVGPTTIINTGVTNVVTYQNSANDRYYQKKITTPRARLLEFAKAKAKSPSGLLLLASIAAYGYFYDSDSDEFLQEQYPEYTSTGSSVIFNVHDNFVITYSNRAEALGKWGDFFASLQAHMLNGHFAANVWPTLFDQYQSISSQPCSTTPCTAQGNFSVTGTYDGVYLRVDGTFIYHRYAQLEPDTETYPIPYGWPEQVPLSESAFWDWLEANPWYAQDLLTYPNGQPINSPEVATGADSLLQDYFVEQGLDPETATASQPVNASQVDTDDIPLTDFLFPGFCEWATVVCDFIAWFTTEPEYEAQPDAPVIELDALDVPSYSSGLPSSATCPAPLLLTVYTKSISISYDAFCELAAIIRPLLIAMAYIMSAYIVLGIGARR